MSRLPERPKHRCPARRCPLMVRYHLLACRAHWFLIPPEWRDAVWNAYRAGGPGSIGHRFAIAGAIAALNDRIPQ